MFIFAQMDVKRKMSSMYRESVMMEENCILTKALYNIVRLFSSIRKESKDPNELIRLQIRNVSMSEVK